MRRLPGLEALRPGLFRGPVATVGMFDGVHLGHRAVVAATASLAREHDGEPVVLTFDVHPRGVVEGAAPEILTPLEHRLRLLAGLGVAGVVVLAFDAALRERSAEWFLEEVVVARLGARGLVLGPDSHFGRDRRGSPALARALLEPRGIPVREAGPVSVGGRPVSSTAIRAAVRSGDLEGAAAMLGRAYSVLGTVVRGDGRGASLGFPTANLDGHGALPPPRGVYAGEATLPGGEVRPCLVNIGGRPTFHADGAVTLEAWIPGWSGDLYGRDLEVAFLARIREERRFDGPAALRAQILADHARMVEWFRDRGGPPAPRGLPAASRGGPSARPHPAGTTEAVGPGPGPEEPKRP